MSTHNIRSMDFEEEYEEFDDVYGHSVKDDFCMSPSQTVYMCNINNPIGSYLNSQKYITEEAEEVETNEELKNAKLESCVEQIRGTLGTTMTRQQIVDAVLAFDYNVERALNSLLSKNPKTQESNRVSKDLTLKKAMFTIPKLNDLKISNNDSSKKFNSLSDYVSDHLSTSPLRPLTSIDTKFNSLSALTNNHLQKVGNNSGSLIRGARDQKLKKDIANLSNGINAIAISDVEDCRVDLSKALIVKRNGIKAAGNRNKTELSGDSANFVPDFIECDQRIGGLDSRKHSVLLDCSLDCKQSVMLAECKLSKKVSRSGRIICMHYKKAITKRIRLSLRAHALMQFNFSVPSPDDIISQYLRRK